ERTEIASSFESVESRLSNRDRRNKERSASTTPREFDPYIELHEFDGRFLASSFADLPGQFSSTTVNQYSACLGSLLTLKPLHVVLQLPYICYAGLPLLALDNDCSFVPIFKEDIEATLITKDSFADLFVWMGQ